MSPYLQHTDAKVWGEDASEFKPERWLGDDLGGRGTAAATSTGTSSLPGGPYSYMPFSRGPRDCIGARFAMLEAKTILAMLVSRFEFEYAGMYVPRFWLLGLGG